MSIKNAIRTIPDFPKKGIQFRDITTLLADADALKETIQLLLEKYKDHNIDYIAGIEARGFIFGTPLALELGKGFIPIRKPGKLPGETIAHSYELEYGSDTLEIHKDALPKGARVLIIDDLLATGGTALAAAELIEKAGATVDAFAFVVDLPDLGGHKKLKASSYDFYTLCKFDGE